MSGRLGLLCARRTLELEKGTQLDSHADAGQGSQALEALQGCHRMALLDLAGQQEQPHKRQRAQWHLDRLGYLMRQSVREEAARDIVGRMLRAVQGADHAPRAVVSEGDQQSS